MAAVLPRIGTVVAWAALVVASCLLWSAGQAAAVSVGAVPQITVLASNSVGVVVHDTSAGATITMDAVIEAEGAAPITADVYVGILSPDGQSASWAGSPEAPTLVNGPPVPFLKNVVPTGAVSYRLVIPNFAASGARGWYMLYGLVVIAGSDPGDPKRWFSSSFVPLLVNAP